ncbi:MAG TPA: metal ABC transporter ATP-binding protein [Bacillota bacterium]|nr:metal ABC transporter ATP-binding protein [Bacillota bacterium]HPF42026.1 metal ABC transporter ATP-binding protein [Bacillota bacterium]HPJ85900.1 metal ABC transporter ATP-binding protein [Bacillota bacterium]HPQ61794.1 metal ABC transporter ATP-binding protein [Bacillota bacterium]HRX91229.1 metal ABC transporter ATP-binding protein [Candidatus Izemoplasmatales bacterium]
MQIDIHNLTFAYGHRSVISGLSLTINPGDYLVVRGKNGSGKTTLIKCLLGYNPVKTGMIFFDHEDINTFTGWTRFGYVNQKFEDFNYDFPITVNEMLSVYSLKETGQSFRLKLLDQLGILGIVNENVNNLSGGQLQRVFIARAMLNQPDVLILDEPTASIDKMNTAYFYQTVNMLNQQGITIILVTHNSDLKPLNFTHVLTMYQDMSYDFQTSEKITIEEAE